MNDSKKIKESVKEKYGQIAKGKIGVIPSITSCCSSDSCCGGSDSTVIDMSSRWRGLRTWMRHSDSLRRA
jgi:hypothetical protein